MQLTPALLDAYRTTSYRILHAGGVIDLAVGSRSPAVEQLLAAAGATSGVFVTAWNPFSEPVDAAANCDANGALVARLTTLGAALYRGIGIGADGRWREDSYFAAGITRHEARSLCREFRQSAVVYVEPPGAATLLFNPLLRLDLRIAAAEGSAHYAIGRRLLEEYAREIGGNLCFQGFESELDSLPSLYGAPRGCLLLGFVAGEPAGCVGVRGREGGVCEMKRLYLRNEWRGTSVGRRLAESAIDFARHAGYTRMELETLPAMKAARSLYESIGFTTAGTRQADGICQLGLELSPGLGGVKPF